MPMQTDKDITSLFGELFDQIRDLRLAAVEEKDSQVSDELMDIEKQRKDFVDRFCKIISS